MSTGTRKCHHLWKEISFDLVQCYKKGHSYHFHPNIWKTEATREGSSWQRTYSSCYAAGSSALLCGRLTPAFFTLFVIAPLHPFLTSPQLRLCQTIARLEKGKQMGNSAGLEIKRSERSAPRPATDFLHVLDPVRKYTLVPQLPSKMVLLLPPW